MDILIPIFIAVIFALLNINKAVKKHKKVLEDSIWLFRTENPLFDYPPTCVDQKESVTENADYEIIAPPKKAITFTPINK